MPLPDERPRASVANLIGRFEQQNKKTAQAGTGPVIPGRSSSVISNITGDSAKEVIKEKREWPPKPANSSVDPPAPIKATPFSTNPGPFVVSGSPDTNDKQAVSVSEPSLPPLPPAEEPAIAPIVADVTHNAQKDSEARSSAVDIHIAEKDPKSPKAQPAKGTKSPPPSSLRTPSKTPAKASPRSVSIPSSTPALRPQHTGQSTTSASSTRKPATPRTAPSTPSRPKTSSGMPSSTLREKTQLSSSRSKTPTPSKTPASHAIPTRAKTPSSNLFAPTAASLARARNASAEAPTPIRKVTLSNSAADRLSKPTASSLSKARSPPPTQTRGSSSSRGASASRSAQRGAKPKVASASKADGSDLTDRSAASDKASIEPNGLDAEVAHGEPDHPNYDPVAHPNLEHGIEDASVHDRVEQAVETNSADEESPSGTASPEKREESEDERSATPVRLEASNVGEKQTENGVHDLAPEGGTDIEDMVNLLEHAKARPVSIINIPDNVNEIPDED